MAYKISYTYLLTPNSLQTHKKKISKFAFVIVGHIINKYA